jgi:hypothetical protein
MGRAMGVMTHACSRVGVNPRTPLGHLVLSPCHFRINPPPTIAMLQISRASTGKPSLHPTHRSIFDRALKAYEDETGKNLSSDPLFCELEKCDSPDSILVTLQQQIKGPYHAGSSDDGLTRWLKPTVNVIYPFSAPIGRAVGQVSPTEREVTRSEPSH